MNRKSFFISEIINNPIPLQSCTICLSEWDYFKKEDDSFAYGCIVETCPNSFLLRESFELRRQQGARINVG